MVFESSSFRDPSGQVFVRDDEIYRSVFSPGVKDFEAARDNGIYDELIEKGYLISHKEINTDFAPKGSIYCLKHPRLPMISYPWEWSFSMLKDAALLHLDIMEILIPKGFWLRDASAFNIQHDGKEFKLIDTLSMGKKISESPWVAYNQFCSHFLAPLAVAANSDIRTLGLWRNYIDGYPLDLAVKMLPVFQKYRPDLYMHLTLHSRFQQKADKQEDLLKEKSDKVHKVSDIAFQLLIIDFPQWHTPDAFTTCFRSFLYFLC